MSILTFVVLFVLIVGGAFGFMVVYDPPISGTYHGIAQDLPSGASGPIRLTLVETDGVLSGELILPTVMKDGGGILAGHFADGEVFFVTTDSAGHKMTWRAAVGSKSAHGRYWWGDLDAAAVNRTDALGVWDASK